jgi:hypothetical protein
MTGKLIARAIECATNSLDKYSNRDLDRFGLEGGVALELLCKAFLSRIDVSLIVDNKASRAFDYLLLARGHPGASVPRGMLRTIGGEIALARATQLLPQLSGHQDTLNLLLQSRNGFLHLGEVDLVTVKTVFARYVASVQILCDALGIDLATIFGPYEDFARRTLETTAEDVKAYVAAEVARARGRFEARFGHMPHESRRAMITIAEQSRSVEKYSEQQVECPACGHLAVAGGDYDVGEWEVDSYDDEGQPDGAFLPVTLHAHEVNCPVCGLELNAAEELEAAGLEVDINIDDVDPGDFIEPDYDYDR